MQRIVGALLVLWGLGWLASEIPVAPDHEQPPMSSWRRTGDGWERAEWLYGNVSRQPPALHPAVVGLALLLFVLAASLGLSPNEQLAPGEYNGGKPERTDWAHTTSPRSQPAVDAQPVE
jgi:hypothetical protein